LGISIQEVEHVAKLARLDLSDQEKPLFTEQLNDILKYVEKLNELDTEHIEPTSHVIPVENVLREDELRPSLPIEKVMLNAPDEDEGQFRVPAVIE